MTLYAYIRVPRAPLSGSQRYFSGGRSRRRRRRVVQSIARPAARQTAPEDRRWGGRNENSKLLGVVLTLTPCEVDIVGILRPRQEQSGEGACQQTQDGVPSLASCCEEGGVFNWAMASF